MKSVFLILNILLNLTAYAGQEDKPLKQFFYKVRLPDTGLECAQEANVLASRFKGVTHQQTVDVKCSGTFEIEAGYKVHSISLSYKAIQEFLPYSIFLGREFLGTPEKSLGIYSSYSSCLADLEKYKSSYETMTGFSVVATTCEESLYSSQKNYSLRIDGFNADPKVTPINRLYAFDIKLQEVDETLKNEIMTLITIGGGKSVFIVNNTAFYYNQYPASVSYGSLGAFQPSECAAQTEEIKRALAKAGSSRSIVRCSPDAYFDKEDNLEVITALRNFPSYFPTRDMYYTFSECMEDRDRVIEQAESRDFSAVGAFCKRGLENRYEMNLFRVF